jgi:hypothetical protein
VAATSPTGEGTQSGLSGKVSLLHNGRKIVTLWQGSYEAPQLAAAPCDSRRIKQCKRRPYRALK